MSTATTFRYHTETINGVEIEKPVPKRLHAIIQKRIMLWMEEQLTLSGYEALPEMDILCGRDRRCPDITVASKDAKYSDGMLDEGAFLVIEILSPGQTIGALFEKCEAYLRHGTHSCWVIWPERRQAWIYTREAIVERSWQQGDSLSAGAEDGFCLDIKLQDLFANLPEAKNLTT